jgi:hypothetical protein
LYKIGQATHWRFWSVQRRRAKRSRLFGARAMEIHGGTLQLQYCTMEQKKKKQLLVVAFGNSEFNRNLFGYK